MSVVGDDHFSYGFEKTNQFLVSTKLSSLFVSSAKWNNAIDVVLYLNPLDYCIWDEFAQTINWDKTTSKSSLIMELKRGVKKIRLDVVRESCSVWPNRLYRMTQNDGNYLRK